jgi:hypothetical protein
MLGYRCVPGWVKLWRRYFETKKQAKRRRAREYRQYRARREMYRQNKCACAVLCALNDRYRPRSEVLPGLLH